MTDLANALTLLRRALGDPAAEFRPGQWAAIDAIVNHRRRLLVVERTGWGKSSVYFIATRILRDRGAGPTLIVSPLLALMRNQVEAADRLGIRAVSINSTNATEWQVLTRSILSGEADAVLISPERLANDRFVEQVLLPVSNRIGLLVVDEAHCISDWGHDFRPDYQRLINVLQSMPRNLPVLGTTATANDRVVTDICAQFSGLQVQRGSLMRESISLQNHRLPDQSARLAWLADHVPTLAGTGIIYALTKSDAEQVAAWLRLNGVDALAYYSGVEAPGFANSDAWRQHLESQLLENRIKVLVATTALGMGYDKPDLGFVIHYQAPGSIIAYYQQVGRAGRAIERAVAVLLSGREDVEIQEYFRNKAFPQEEQVLELLEALAASDGLTVRELEQAVNLRQGQIDKVLKFLSVGNPAPVLRLGGKWVRTPVPYRMDHGKIQRLTQQREREWQDVQDYIACRSCLMEYLAKKLDDAAPGPCGKCAQCLGRPVVAENFTHARAVSASLFLKQAEFPLECRKQASKGAFPEYGFKGNLPATLRAEQGRILARWGDAGWGRVVAHDKHAGRFRDELVQAVAEMVQLRWQPKPGPTWATCVPSLHHPELVPDFAARLAGLLGLPFLRAVAKVKDNAPQKAQQNGFHQCHNLDGVFVIRPGVPTGAVLLVDDMVDSGWTLTVVAALLRRAGSGPVWPLALASAAAGD